LNKIVFLLRVFGTKVGGRKAFHFKRSGATSTNAIYNRDQKLEPKAETVPSTTAASDVGNQTPIRQIAVWMVVFQLRI